MVLRMSSAETEQRLSSSATRSAAWPAAVRRFLGPMFTHYATVLIVLLMGIVFSFLSKQFLTSLNLTNLLVVQVTVSCMTFAAIVPLIIGEFDLSLGYSLGFLMMFGAFLGGEGYGAWVVIPAMLIGGIAIGVLNGFIRVRFQISSFIATLGVGITLSGMTQGMSGGKILYGGIPQIVTDIAQGDILGLGVSVWLVVVLAFALIFMLEHTPFGRQLYAIGGSERVAFLAGIRIGFYRILAFAIAGLLVAVAAIFELGQSGAASPMFGPDLLLPAYAASFLGVTTYRPGYFNIPGAVIAIVLLAVGFNGLSLVGVPFWLQPVFNGIVLILAVITAKAEGRQIQK